MDILAIDPSGSFEEGKGITGIVIEKDNKITPKQFRAADFSSRQEYWEAMIDYIIKSNVHFVVIESFKIRDVKFLRGSSPETLQFIGVLTHSLSQQNIPYYIQDPGSVKYRFKNEILVDKIDTLEYDEETNYYRLDDKIINAHIRDALRHLLYFKRYNLPKYIAGTLYKEKKKKRRQTKWKTF